MKRVEIGVFLPDAKNGFINSTNSPPYYPTYRDQLEITLLAEEARLDYVFSMLKWRGFGGTTQIWDASFESFSLMTALAAATSDINLIATVNPLLYHPVVMAKMTATVQDVSGGRLGLNIITGSTLGEYTQMGVLPDSYEQKRYDVATEWIQVVKRLWAEPRVTHHGEYFHLEDCVSEPKPRPRPFLVCAGTSEEGLRFTAREADYSFLTKGDLDDLAEMTRRAERIAAEEHKALKTATPVLLVLGDTKAEAQAYWEYLLDGADVEVNSTSSAAYGDSSRARNQALGAQLKADPRRISFGNTPHIGGPEDIAEELIDLAVTGGVDNLCLLFPDYVDGLKKFKSAVMPLLQDSLDIGAPGR